MSSRFVLMRSKAMTWRWNVGIAIPIQITRKRISSAKQIQKVSEFWYGAGTAAYKSIFMVGSYTIHAPIIIAMIGAMYGSMIATTSCKERFHR